MMKLEPNQWIEELLVRGRPDGGTAAHVVIGTMVESMGSKSLHTSTHPVAVLQGEAGIPIADVVGQLVIGLGAQVESLKAEVSHHKAKTLEAHEHLAKERKDHAETAKRADEAHRQLRLHRMRGSADASIVA
jgi:hypothetical protein